MRRSFKKKERTSPRRLRASISLANLCHGHDGFSLKEVELNSVQLTSFSGCCGDSCPAYFLLLVGLYLLLLLEIADQADSMFLSVK